MSQIVLNTRGLGLDFAEQDATCIARGGAITRGDIVAAALIDNSVISDDGVTVSIAPGDTGSVFANVTKAYSQMAVRAGLFAVALENVADQAKGRFRFMGIVLQALTANPNNTSINTGGFVTIGDGTFGALGTLNTQFAPAILGATQSTDSSTRKIVGFTLARVTTLPTSTASLQPVLFDGINGFGGINLA